MTARQLKHGLFLGFLMLINSIFWGLLLQALPCQWRAIT